MEISLNELLDRTLVVPYDEETVTRLDEVCNSYVDDENEFNDDSIADLIVIVLTHNSVTTLKSSLEKLYQEKNEEEFKIPRSVCETLAAYMLMLAMEKDNITYKLALMNTLIIQNGHLDELPFATFFASAVQDALSASDKEGELEKTEETAFVKKLFDPKITKPFSLDEEERRITQNLARKAWYYDMREYIDGDQLRGLQVYAKVYKAITHIVYSMSWQTYNQQAMNQIKRIVPPQNKDAKTIEEIVRMVRPLYDQNMDVRCHSSVLLQVIADESHEYNKMGFMKSKLTARQFAVWLYYELLLEKYFV